MTEKLIPSKISFLRGVQWKESLKLNVYNLDFCILIQVLAAGWQWPGGTRAFTQSFPGKHVHPSASPLRVLRGLIRTQELIVGDSLDINEVAARASSSKDA